MAELKNTFSWSHSASTDFDECRRKRYWSKYGMWNGWSRDATEEQRAAYRLNKMQNRHSLKGQAAELAVMWVLRQKQAGTDVTADQAYEEVARPWLNQAWQESKKGLWKKDPKRHVCLHEHYYPDLNTIPSEEWTAALTENVKLCITQFIDHTLPRLADVRPEEEIEVGTIEKGGDPESFEIEGVKIYAIPDYVYARDDIWHIHDWKSGRRSDGHKDQMGIYALWALHKHRVPVERIRIYLEYLMYGEVEEIVFTEEELAGSVERIGASISDMTEYLEDFDRSKNRPLPKDLWELADDRRSCRRCSFYELCAAELD